MCDSEDDLEEDCKNKLNRCRTGWFRVFLSFMGIQRHREAYLTTADIADPGEDLCHVLNTYSDVKGICSQAGASVQRSPARRCRCADRVSTPEHVETAPADTISSVRVSEIRMHAGQNGNISKVYYWRHATQALLFSASH